jgi:hypothetical protein
MSNHDLGVVNGHTLELRPGPGTTAPLIAKAVPLPPASPVTTATLPWAATNGDTARARRKILENILVFGGSEGVRWLEYTKRT